MVVGCRLLVLLGRFVWLLVVSCWLLVSLGRRAYLVAERSRSDSCSKQKDGRVLLAMTLTRKFSVSSFSFQMFSLASTTVSSSEFRGTRKFACPPIRRVSRTGLEHARVLDTNFLLPLCFSKKSTRTDISVCWEISNSKQLQFSVVFVSEYHCQFE